MTAKRRYIQRRFHSAFGYYIGAVVVKTQTETVIRNLAPGAYGRPDLCSEETEQAFPLVWNADEAREFYSRRERFAFIGTSGKAGFQDEDTYTRYGDKEPDFSRVADCYDAVVKQKIQYV